MAKSVAPLCDGGLFAFIARIWPKEALSVASGFSDSYVRLNLYIYEVWAITYFVTPFQYLQLSILFCCEPTYSDNDMS